MARHPMEQRLYPVPSIAGAIVTSFGGALCFTVVGTIFGPIGLLIGFSIGAALAANHLTGLRRKREDIRRLNFVIEQNNAFYREHFNQ